MTLTQAFYWVIRSSENPQKWSATIKGIAASIIPVLAILHFDTSALPEVFQNLAMFAEYFALGISAGYTTWGAIRKAKTTILGTNQVLNDRIWE